MIERRIATRVTTSLKRSPAVVLIGPRQAGKTTLALALAEGRAASYLDLESEPDRARLSEPDLYFADHADELVVLVSRGMRIPHFGERKFPTPPNRR